MQKRIIHNLLSRKWLILLCFMLLPTVLEAFDWADNRTSFYKQVTVLSYKSKSTNDKNGSSYNQYMGAKLRLSNGAIIELSEYDSYVTFVSGSTHWGYIHSISMKINWTGSKQYRIRLGVNSIYNGYIKEERSTKRNSFKEDTQEDLYWELSQPNADFSFSAFSAATPSTSICACNSAMPSSRAFASL